jgi:hypothetical protein
VPRPRQAHPVHRCGYEKRLAAADLLEMASEYEQLARGAERNRND